VLTAARLVADANQIAKGKGFIQQGLEGLNAILGDLCEQHDLALACGTFNFNFNPSLTGTLFGSGPYPLPLDYLRTAGALGARGQTKSAWYLYPTPVFPAGQPMYLTAVDLAEFDLMPKLPSQSTPNLWATDMSGPLTQRIVLNTTMGVTSGSTTAAPADTANLAAGLAVAGEGILPGTTILSTALPNITLSQPATATILSASVFFGIPPNGYAYPAPNGTWPVTIRYQRKMPPLVDTSQIPWFPNAGYLIDKLAAWMMAFTGDSRIDAFNARAARELSQYLGLADDRTNRAQAVQLDPRTFGQGGPGGRGLKMTKTAGWG
jgi:hypothetical protein